MNNIGENPISDGKRWAEEREAREARAQGGDVFGEVLRHHLVSRGHFNEEQLECVEKALHTAATVARRGYFGDEQEYLSQIDAVDNDFAQGLERGFARRRISPIPGVTDRYGYAPIPEVVLERIPQELVGLGRYIPEEVLEPVVQELLGRSERVD